MSASPANVKSPLGLGPQVSSMTHADPKSEKTASPSAAVSNRTVALRSRKACVGGAPSEVEKNQKPSGGATEPSTKSKRQRGIAAESPGGVDVKKENHRRLWVALSRDEIEEDVFGMSGNKPSRRPRKRTKTLQKHLDVMFPGLGLVGLNADCFRVAASPAK